MQHSERKPDMINENEFLWICDLVKDLVKKRDINLGALFLSTLEKKRKQKDKLEPLKVDKSH